MHNISGQNRTTLTFSSFLQIYNDDTLSEQKI